MLSEHVDTGTTTQAVYAAVLAIKGIGGALGFAVLCAAWEAMSPDSLHWVTSHAGSGALMALRLVTLVTLAVWVWRLMGTYIQTQEGHPITRHGVLPEDTRRRLYGRGHRGQSPGRHRAL